MTDNSTRPPRRPPTEEQEIKPDTGGEDRSPAAVLRRERDTYGDDSTFPNRQDTEDEHGGGEDTGP